MAEASGSGGTTVTCVANATALSASASGCGGTVVTGIGNAIAPKVSVVPPRPPHTYLGMAYALLRGVNPLAHAGISASIPLAFVAAQVTECALKAYLSRSGDDKPLRKPSIRHNLKALWQLAETEGLALPSPQPAWVATLSLLHDAPYFIRYATGVHGMGTPAPEPMVTDLTALVDLVAAALH